MDQGTRRPTLARVLETLGPGMVEALTWPDAGEVEVLGPRIFDPLDAGSIGAGDVVLAVSVTAPSDDSRRLMELASRAGAAAVVFRTSPDTAVPESERVAVLRVSTAVTWDQLHTLLRNAIAATEVPWSLGETTPLGDLFALANAVAAMVGGAVTIEDPQSNVLAYSTLDHVVDEARRETILGRRVPDWWTRRLRDQGVFHHLWSSPAVVRFEDPEGQALPRLVTSIRAGTEVLGSIWVIEGDARLGPEAEQALTEAARVAALHLLRHEAAEDLDRRERANVLRALLEGRRSAADTAAVLSLEVERPCAVIAFRLMLEDAAELSAKRSRAVDLVTVYCEGFRRRAACAWTGDTVYVLLPSLDAATSARVTAWAEEIAGHVSDALRIEMHVGVGSTVPSVRDALQSRQEADRVLRVLSGERGPASQVAHIDHVRVQAVLLELGDVLRDRPDLRLPALDALAAHDAAYGKPYVETLAAYLDAFGDVAAAADAINLHPNSFRYRLRRLRELSGIDLSNPDDRLVAALHLRFREP